MMIKRITMLAFIAAAFLFGSACFLYDVKDDAGSSTAEACKGLEGPAQADCEKRHGG